MCTEVILSIVNSACQHLVAHAHIIKIYFETQSKYFNIYKSNQGLISNLVDQTICSCRALAIKFNKHMNKHNNTYMQKQNTEITKVTHLCSAHLNVEIASKTCEGILFHKNISFTNREYR